MRQFLRLLLIAFFILCAFFATYALLHFVARRRLPSPAPTSLRPNERHRGTDPRRTSSQSQRSTSALRKRQQKSRTSTFGRRSKSIALSFPIPPRCPYAQSHSLPTENVSLLPMLRAEGFANRRRPASSALLVSLLSQLISTLLRNIGSTGELVFDLLHIRSIATVSRPPCRIGLSADK